MTLKETGEVEVSVVVEQSETMAAPWRCILDYARPNLDGATSSIIRPLIAGNNFELNPNFIQMVQKICQFDNFLTNFLEIWDTLRTNGVPWDAIRFYLFPFSVWGWAKHG